MNWEAHEFGRLYLDGIPCKILINPTVDGDVPHHDMGQRISLGDTVDGEGITWIKPSWMNLYVADRVLLSCVSWDELQKAGFFVGTQVIIDGMIYRCRLLQTGDDQNCSVANEWDDILSMTTTDNDIWHWRNMYFWGVDVADVDIDYRAIRGGLTAHGWGRELSSKYSKAIGFRPVLELLDPQPPSFVWPVTLDGVFFSIYQLPGYDGNQFQPTLQPLGKCSFRDIPDGTTMSMYTLLMDGQPVRQDLPEPAVWVPGAPLTITDRFYGEEYLIPWKLIGGLPTASQPILKGITEEIFKLEEPKQ